MNTTLFEQTDSYISELLASEDEALHLALESIERAGMPQHSITANQGKFLQVLMRSIGAKTVLELGTLAGYSTIWLARALPPEGKVTTIEAEPERAIVASENIDNAGLSEKVDLLMGKALDVLPHLVAENEKPFDFIFVDADKQNSVEYFYYALRLSRKGTVIVFDNVLRQGEVFDENSTDERVIGVQNLNKLLGESKAVTATILPMVGTKEFDGMAIAVVN